LCKPFFYYQFAPGKEKRSAPIAFYELKRSLCMDLDIPFITSGYNKNMLLKPADIGYLVLLGTVCTSLAYVAGVSVMRELSAFRVALITNLEPVYGIIMSFIFFGDMNKMTLGFWGRCGLILSTIFLYPVAQKQITRRKISDSNLQRYSGLY
jgi:drug/metabolite transporter (DMT)-like permease